MAPLPNGLVVGVVSEGTVRLEDLVQAALGVLRKLDPALAAQFDVMIANDASPSEQSDTYEDLLTAIDAKLPEGYWFGPTDGDGACYGIWEINDLFDGSTQEEEQEEVPFSD